VIKRFVLLVGLLMLRGFMIFGTVSSRVIAAANSASPIFDLKITKGFEGGSWSLPL
jgi:hypothetical protein